MSRSIGRTGSAPFTARLSCSRLKCEQEATLDVELDQALFERSHRVGFIRTGMPKEERDALDAARMAQFDLMRKAPTPAGWIRLDEPNFDHPSEPRPTREFCSWRCVRLFAAGRENGKDV